jgi:hypothetical protein
MVITDKYIIDSFRFAIPLITSVERVMQQRIAFPKHYIIWMLPLNFSPIAGDELYLSIYLRIYLCIRSSTKKLETWKILSIPAAAAAAAAAADVEPVTPRSAKSLHAAAAALRRKTR